MTGGRVRRFIVLLALSVAVFVGGYAWHQREQQLHLVNESTAKLREILIKEQAVTEQVLQPPPDGITYDKFFRQCERSLDERDQLVVEVRLLRQDVLSGLHEQIISLMKALNELTRAKVELMRLVAQWSSMASNHSAYSARLEAEFFRTHVGGKREAIEWAYKMTTNRLEALAKELTQSAAAFDEMYDKATDVDEAVFAEVRRYGIDVQPQLKKFSPANKALSARVRKAAN